MPSEIWSKYKLLKEIGSNSNIKSYLTRIEPIVKEITSKNKDDYYMTCQKLEKIKKRMNIYEIIKEYNKIYIVIENDSKLSSEIDRLLLSDELNVIKQAIIKGQGTPIAKTEIYNLFQMEKSMCRISFETIEGNKGFGSGFFCELNIDFPFKYALFTNNHILNEFNIEIGKTINFQHLKLEKSLFSSSYKNVNQKIKITQNRKVFTDKELDYTCIELFESDGIIDFFKIEPNLLKHGTKILEDNDIFILQFPLDNEICYSSGKVLGIKNNIISHNASTEKGSTGSPIIRRCKDNYILGIHFGSVQNKFNLAIPFDSILNNLKKQYNNN